MPSFFSWIWVVKGSCDYFKEIFFYFTLHKELSIPLRIFSLNATVFPADSITFTEQIFNRELQFLCSVTQENSEVRISHGMFPIRFNFKRWRFTKPIYWFLFEIPFDSHASAKFLKTPSWFRLVWFSINRSCMYITSILLQWSLNTRCVVDHLITSATCISLLD